MIPPIRFAARSINNIRLSDTPGEPGRVTYPQLQTFAQELTRQNPKTCVTLNMTTVLRIDTYRDGTHTPGGTQPDKLAHMLIEGPNEQSLYRALIEGFAERGL